MLRINETCKLGGLAHGVMRSESPAHATQELGSTPDGSPVTHPHPGAIRSLKQTAAGLQGESGLAGGEAGQRSRSADQSFPDILTRRHSSCNPEKEMKGRPLFFYGRSGKQRKIFGSHHQG